jgi:CHAD domain-containing protein
MAAHTKTTAPAGRQRLTRLTAEEGLWRLFAQRREQLGQHYTLFIQQGGEEALHDLRVSLRRLHSLLRNYRDVINGPVPLEEKLHHLQQQTNPARDLEVFVAQLKQACPGQPQLIAVLQHPLEQAYRQLHQDLPPQWNGLLPLLEYPPSVTLDDDDKHNRLGTLTASLGQQQLRRIKKGFKSLRHHWDEARLHRLRIHGKRLRYLLEPFAEEPGLAKSLALLKRFQEELGDYRDLQLLLQHLTAWQLEIEPDPANSAAIVTLIEALQTSLQQQKKQARKYRKRHKQQLFLKPLQRALQQLRKNSLH